VKSPSLSARTLAAFCLCAPFALTACVSTPEDAPDKLTVGTVQREIKVGMDAGTVAEVLGSPNIVTTDADGNEKWIYDKVSSDRVAESGSFGGGIIIFGGSKSKASSSSTQRTLTIVIKFDENDLVRDVAYNYSQF